MNCNKCNCILDKTNWLPSRQKRNQAICKYCTRKDNNQRYINNKLNYSYSFKKKYTKIKKDIFNYYGSKCQLCDETDYNKLSLDHIDMNGRQHRQSILKTDSGTAFYKWVYKNKPNNIRILCFNCNCQHSMQKYNLIINNKNYLNNKLCKYCYANSKLNKFVCSQCNSKLKRNYQINLKLKVYQQYGNACNVCGCNKLEFLTIDHINNNGAEHRKKIYNIYSWLKINNYPKDNYQILCFNCNYSKHFKL